MPNGRLRPEASGPVDRLRGGHRLEVPATRRHLRSMLSRGCTHLECPRQEEQAQLPHRHRLVVPSGTPIPPTAAKVSVGSNSDFVREKLRPSLAVVKCFVSRGAAPSPWRMSPLTVGRCTKAVAHVPTDRGALHRRRGARPHRPWGIAPSPWRTFPPGRGALHHRRGARPHRPRGIAPRPWCTSPPTVGHCTTALAHLPTARGSLHHGLGACPPDRGHCTTVEV